MKMIRAIIRPEKKDDVLRALLEAGFPSVTTAEVYGRGKQMGLKIGEVFYDELPKEMLIIVAEADKEEEIVSIITENAKTGSGNFGDGRIFVTEIEKAYTISTMTEGL